MQYTVRHSHINFAMCTKYVHCKTYIPPLQYHLDKNQLYNCINKSILEYNYSLDLLCCHKLDLNYILQEDMNRMLC